MIAAGVEQVPTAEEIQRLSLPRSARRLPSSRSVIGDNDVAPTPAEVKAEERQLGITEGELTYFMFRKVGAFRVVGPPAPDSSGQKAEGTVREEAPLIASESLAMEIVIVDSDKENQLLLRQGSRHFRVLSFLCLNLQRICVYRVIL